MMFLAVGIERREERKNDRPRIQAAEDERAKTKEANGCRAVHRRAVNIDKRPARLVGLRTIVFKQRRRRWAKLKT